MNNIRRKAIDALVERLDILRSDIEMIAEEEQDAFDNLPEGIQVSERGEAMEQAADELSDIGSDAEDLMNRLQETTA